MHRDYLAAVRAQAALTAYRVALDLLRHKSSPEAERRLLAKIDEARRALAEAWRARAERLAKAADEAAKTDTLTDKR